MNRTALAAIPATLFVAAIAAGSFYAGRRSAPDPPPPVIITTPATAASAQAPGVAPVPDPVVWVNLRSGIYHSRGDRWYGATKDGAYMHEDTARAQGFRAAITY